MKEIWTSTSITKNQSPGHVPHGLNPVSCEHAWLSCVCDCVYMLERLAGKGLRSQSTVTYSNLKSV